jgi:urea carboxylase-associated protein 2
VLCSIIGDTCGWHDTLSGCGNAESSRTAFGEGRYQELRNDFHRNARDNFTVELSKHGLGKRDVVANVNFFVRVLADGDGNLSFRSGNSRPGAYVDLRFEMDALAVLTNTPHPLDPASRYAPPAIDLVIWRGEPPRADDECRRSRPENERGFALTETYVRERAS